MPGPRLPRLGQPGLKAPAGPLVPGRRRLLQGASAAILAGLWTTRTAQGASLLAVRIWPGRDYTRVTLEHDAPLKFSHFLLRDAPPLRLVVDLEDIALTASLSNLVGKVDASDPYISRIRIGQNRPNVVRLVIDLKSEVKPQLYQLEPAGPYRYRLLFDLYPESAPDPLMALLRESEAAPLDAPQAAPPADSDAQLPPADGATAPDPKPDDSAASADAPAGTPSPAAPSATPTKPSPQPRPPAQSLRRLITVAIDAGHGGEDPGAIGRHGTHEKTVTLSVAQRLAGLIAKDPSMRVLLTRDGDYFVPLGERVQKARQVHADLFVSIHADSWIRSDARGSTVFALSEHGASNAAAAELARHENQSDLIGGVNLAKYEAPIRSVVLDLSTSAQISDSLKFGGAVLRELEHVNRLHRAQVEQASFAVLKAPDIPSILVETAFISNPDEERRLRDEAYQRQLATAIFNGIRRYFDRNPPPARNPVG
jgi:N-acetylmuramoyl-L-alanine amidase